MTRIAVVGSINTDFVVRAARFPAPGETIIGDSFAVYGGGKGANQAIAAARLGGSVEFFGAIGRDPQSADRVRQLNADAVGTSNVVEFDGFGGIAVIAVERASGQNSITLIPGANAQLDRDEVSRRLERWCHAGDLICVQLEVPFESVEIALSMKHRFGLTTVVNAAPYDSRAVALLPLTDYLMVNEIEAGQLLGTGAVTVSEAGEAGSRLLKMGVGAAVVITLGADGATLIDHDGELHLPARAVPVVDTTGAGDTFVGAFCAALAAGQSPREAANRAGIASSLAVQKQGAQPSIPSLAELQAALD
jgi:ribokinase